MCEAVVYEVSNLGLIYNCHCSKCRRWHGSAFRTRTTVQLKDFKWLQGEEHVKAYDAPHESVIKTFCGICGSCLISRPRNNPDVIGLPIGALEQDPGVRPIGHIFVGSKSPWYEITDDLPQYQEWPTDNENFDGYFGT